MLLPAEMPVLPGLRVPRDFYWVLSGPAPLAGMASPDWPPLWEAMHAAGFRHVVCLTHDRFPYQPDPLNALFATRLEDLFGGRQPGDPQAEQRGVRAAASAVLDRYRAGEGVIVHCQGGTGRTGTVLGCVLRALGFSGLEAIQYLEAVNRARGQAGWPESSWQSSLVAGEQAFWDLSPGGAAV